MLFGGYPFWCWTQEKPTRTQPLFGSPILTHIHLGNPWILGDLPVQLRSGVGQKQATQHRPLVVRESARAPEQNQQVSSRSRLCACCSPANAQNPKTKELRFPSWGTGGFPRFYKLSKPSKSLNPELTILDTLTEPGMFFAWESFGGHHLHGLFVHDGKCL